MLTAAFSNINFLVLHVRFFIWCAHSFLFTLTRHHLVGITCTHLASSAARCWPCLVCEYRAPCTCHFAFVWVPLAPQCQAATAVLLCRESHVEKTALHCTWHHAVCTQRSLLHIMKCRIAFSSFRPFGWVDVMSFFYILWCLISAGEIWHLCLSRQCFAVSIITL